MEGFITIATILILVCIGCTCFITNTHIEEQSEEIKTLIKAQTKVIKEITDVK